MFLINTFLCVFYVQIYPVSQLSEEHSHLEPSDFQESMKLLTTDTKSAMLHGKYCIHLFIETT